MGAARQGWRPFSVGRGRTVAVRPPLQVTGGALEAEPRGGSAKPAHGQLSGVLLTVVVVRMQQLVRLVTVGGTQELGVDLLYCRVVVRLA